MPLILPNTIANETPADGDKLQQNFAAIQDWINNDLVNADGSVGMTSPLLLSGPPTQPNQAATKGYVDNFLPVGVIWMYGGITVPNANWMMCDGAAISRTTYAALFAVFSTRFGTGNGSTTFNLPDMRARYPVGQNQGGSSNDEGGPAAHWTSGVGEKAGNYYVALSAHQHSVSLTTSASGPHQHQIVAPSRADTVAASGGNSFLYPGVDITYTSTWNGDHTHGVTGSSTFAGTANAVQISPGLAFNFIVKVS